MPSHDIVRIGTKLNDTMESMNSLIFLAKVHLVAPEALACFT